MASSIYLGDYVMASSNASSEDISTKSAEYTLNSLKNNVPLHIPTCSFNVIPCCIANKGQNVSTYGGYPLINVSANFSKAPNLINPIPATTNNFVASNFSLFTHSPFVSSATHQPTPVRFQSFSTIQSPIAPTPAQQNLQRLKVEDALSYLDQVKARFSGQPRIYNDFLDIMKEFKTQSIDTPGVIGRVSALFKDHLDLIFGFNTFLPPGFKVDMETLNKANKKADPKKVYMLFSSSERPISSTASSENNMRIPDNSALKDKVSNSIKSEMSPLQHLQRKLQQQQVPPQKLSPKTETLCEETLFVSNSLKERGKDFETVEVTLSPEKAEKSKFVKNTSNSSSNQQPLAFTHAINYVNEIKNRFQKKPEIYKKFLEILHRFRKEQKAIKDPINDYSDSNNDLLLDYEDDDDAGDGDEDDDDEDEDDDEEGEEAIGDDEEANDEDDEEEDDFGDQEQGSKMKKVCLLENEEMYPNTLKEKNGNKSPRNNHSKCQNNNNQQDRADVRKKRKRKMTSTSLLNSNRQGGGPLFKDVTVSQAAKYGNLKDFAFFDKLSVALKSSDVYENFLRTLNLYILDIISDVELLGIAQKFLIKHPDLFNELKDIVNYVVDAVESDDSDTKTSVAEKKPMNPLSSSANPSSHHMLNTVNIGTASAPTHLGIKVKDSKRLLLFHGFDAGIELDYSSLKKCGVSYRALPKSYQHPKCSGRTTLCREVLNDTFVSFPCWSEDSNFIASKKSQYEENLYRIEDERFELDVIIEANRYTVKVLEEVEFKLSRYMSNQKNGANNNLSCNNNNQQTTNNNLYTYAHFELDNRLGGSSEVIHRKAIYQIYGDKADEIIDGLKTNPVIALPYVLRRLKAKDEEWRNAQRSFNIIWREQCERNYLKSLDYIGVNFKASDTKALKSKALINEIEVLRAEKEESNEINDNSVSSTISPSHLSISLDKREESNDDTPSSCAVFRDACDLLIYHTKRQAGIQKKEKAKMKSTLRKFLPSLFAMPSIDGSDDENIASNHDEEDDDDDEIYPDNNNDDDDDRDLSASDAAESSNESNSSSKKTVKRKMKEVTKSKVKKLNDEERSKKESTASHDTPPPLAPSVPATPNVLIPATNDSLPNHQQIGVISCAQNLKCAKEVCCTLFANTTFYLFMRYFVILWQRLYEKNLLANTLTREHALEGKHNSESVSIALRLKDPDAIKPMQYYSSLLEAIKSYLDANIDSVFFEDSIRDMFTIHAYPCYTIDKVIHNAVRQLHSICTDEVPYQLLSLFQNNLSVVRNETNPSSASSRQSLISYRKKAKQLIQTDDMFLQFDCYQKPVKLRIRILDSPYTSASTLAVSSIFNACSVPIKQEVKEEGDDKQDPNSHTQLQHTANSLWLNYLHNFTDASNAFDRKDVTHTLKTLLLATTPPTDDAQHYKFRPLFLIRNLEKVLSKRFPKRRLEPAQEENRLKNLAQTLSLIRMDDDKDLMIAENLECKFSPNSYKLTFLPNSFDLFYRKDTFKSCQAKHKQNSLIKYKRMQKNVIAQWLDKQENLDELEKRTKLWLINATNGSVDAPTQTTNTPSSSSSVKCSEKGAIFPEKKISLSTFDDESQIPYHPFNRYVFVSK